jgi:hypothetical protein
MTDSTSTDQTGVSPRLWKRLRARFGRGGLALLAFVACVGTACLVHFLGKLDDWEKMSALLEKFFLQAERYHEAGMLLKPREFGVAGVWLGCAFGAVVCGLLLLGAWFWIPDGRAGMKRAPHLPMVSGVLPYLCVMLAVATTVWIRAPRLDHSFWNDEEYSLRCFSHGRWEQGKDGGWKFDAVDWNDTLFECRNGNNHHMNSVLVRCSQEAWRWARGEPREVFSETAARLPAFVAGAFTVLLVFIIGVELGWAWVGVGAAWLLALNPWHVRYAVEERGYSSMLFFFCLALVGLIRAFRTNKTSDWLLFATGEAASLLNFVGALYPVLFVNVVAFLELMLRKEYRRMGTLLGFNLLAAVPVAVWVFPSVPQIIHVLLHDPTRFRPGVGAGWAIDLFTHLLAGMHYELPEPERHLGTTWLRERDTSLFYTWCMDLVCVLLVIGMLVALRKSSASRLAVLAPLAAGVFMTVENAMKNGALLIWYLLYLLVPLVLAVPLAVARLFSSRESAIAPAIVCLVAGYALATSDMRWRMVTHDRQPMRQTVAWIKEQHPEAMTGVFGVSDRQTQSYDPRVRILNQEADLDKAIADAASERRPLYVYFCGRTESGKRNPALMTRVLDEAIFEKKADFPGLEAMFSYEVWKLRK